MADTITSVDNSQLLEHIDALAAAIRHLSTLVIPQVDTIVTKGACQNIITSFFNVPTGSVIQIADGNPRRFGINFAVQTGSDTVIIKTAIKDAVLAYVGPGDEKYYHFDKHGAITQLAISATCLVSSTLCSVTEVLLNC